jgi:hypothetical protein
MIEGASPETVLSGFLGFEFLDSYDIARFADKMIRNIV